MADMLAAYRVLDLCDAKGALCTKILADLGAAVIMIEPLQGNNTRYRPPFYHDQPNPEKSLFFWYFHTNKRSMTLNLETADGRQLFKALLPTADIVVETLPPSYLERLGLAYAELRTLHPGLIMTSITGFGQDGPYRDYRISAIVGLPMGSLMQLCGEPGQSPVRPGGDQGEHTEGQVFY